MQFFWKILCGLAGVTGLAAAGPLLFSVTPIQAPPGYTTTNAFPGINNLGQVVGAVSGSGGVDSLFISNGSSFTLVAIPSNWDVNHVFINSAGQIAGWATILSSGALVPFIGTAAGVAAIPLPPEGDSTGADILGFNNSGQVVGNFDTSDGFQAFVGTSAGITLLPYGTGLAINDSGQVLVGNSDTVFILTGMTAASVSGCDASEIGGVALNNAGQVLFGGFAGGTPCVTTANTATPIPQVPGTGNNLNAGNQQPGHRCWG